MKEFRTIHFHYICLYLCLCCAWHGWASFVWYYCIAVSFTQLQLHLLDWLETIFQQLFLDMPQVQKLTKHVSSSFPRFLSFIIWAVIFIGCLWLLRIITCIIWLLSVLITCMSCFFCARLLQQCTFWCPWKIGRRYFHVSFAHATCSVLKHKYF